MPDDLLGPIDRQTVKQVDIDKIYPDRTQPRRAVPTAVRDAWDGTPRTVTKLFDAWGARIEEDSKRTFDLRLRLSLDERNADTETDDPLVKQQIAALGGSEDDTDLPEHTPGPVEAALMRIVDLAVSINTEGLANAITVANDNGRYMLETGERRWLAFHLLRRVYGDDKWNRIPARVVDRVSVWRQAAENNTRADLNAVSRARQFAVLMMDLYRREKNHEFQVYDAFETDQEYYQQAADLDMPYGKGELVLNAMGVTNRSAISRARKLLKGHPFLWQEGDDHNLSINDLVRLCDLDEPIAREELDKLLHGATFRSAPVAPPRAKKSNSASLSVEPGTPKHFSQVLRQVRKAQTGDRSQVIAAQHYLGELRKWIEQQEREIEQIVEDKES